VVSFACFCLPVPVDALRKNCGAAGKGLGKKSHRKHQATIEALKIISDVKAARETPKALATVAGDGRSESVSGPRRSGDGHLSSGQGCQRSRARTAAG
jgi:hypothetical protein